MKGVGRGLEEEIYQAVQAPVIRGMHGSHTPGVLEPRAWGGAWALHFVKLLE